MAFPDAEQLETLAAVINQAMKLDPLAQQRFARLAGKSIRIECTEPAADLVIEIGEHAIYLKPPGKQPVTSHLTGDLAAFTKLLTADDKAAALINADVRLHGDSQLLIELQKVLASIDLDWEFHLAKLLGDLPAHLIGKFGRSSWGWLKHTRPVFMRHLQEYILEEARLSPDKTEMEGFITGVQALDERVERLQARLQRLRNKCRQHPSRQAQGNPD